MTLFDLCFLVNGGGRALVGLSCANLTRIFYLFSVEKVLSAYTVHRQQANLTMLI